LRLEIWEKRETENRGIGERKWGAEHTLWLSLFLPLLCLLILFSPLDCNERRVFMTLPLAHIRVIDLTRARSGPTCVRQLADMGTQVIKVEQADDEEGVSRYNSDFQNLHRNKRSMVLNLKDQRGVAILKQLVKNADVLVENYCPDVKKRFGIA
jgi:hypothetical protein